MIHFKRWLKSGAVLFAAVWPALASGHPAFQDQMRKLAESKIPENLDLSRVKSGTNFVVRYHPEGAAVPVADLHAWTVMVEDKDGRPAARCELSFGADMPQHLHGLGSVPRVTRLGPGRFRVDGLNFQMPGWWKVEIEVRGGAAQETFRFDLVL